jgi:DNA recombination protein RmuC
MGFSIDPISLILGLVLGAGAVWLVLRNSGARAAAQAKAVLEQEHAMLADRLAAEFRKLSTDALGQNNRQFLDLARTQFDGFQAAAKGDISQMLQPVKESLAKVDKQISDIEKERVGA